MFRLPSNVAQLRHAWRAVSEDPHCDRSTPCFRMAETAEVPTLHVFDVIGGWDNDAAEFAKTVGQIKADAINLHINSPGGFVFDAVAMFDALVQHPAAVHVRNVGLAASAASFLAMAGDTVDTVKGSRWMIHDAQVLAFGSPAELRDAAALGDEISDDIAGFYADRAGGKPADWRALMSAETWYSADQAVEAKLADRVTGRDEKKDGASNRSRLAKARMRVTLGGV